MLSKDLWINGIEVDDKSTKPIRIISPRIELTTPSFEKHEILEVFISQIDAVVVKAAEDFGFSTKSVGTEIEEDGFEYNIIELKRTNELLIQLEIAHGCPIPDRGNGGTTTGSIIGVVYSLIPNRV